MELARPEAMGVKIIYTDISRDGTLHGPDRELEQLLAAPVYR